MTVVKWNLPFTLENELLLAPGGCETAAGVNV